MPATNQHLSLSGDWVTCQATKRACPRTTHRQIPEAPPAATRMDGAPTLAEQKHFTWMVEDTRRQPPAGWTREHVWIGRARDNSDSTIFARHNATGNLFKFEGRSKGATEPSDVRPAVHIAGQQTQYRTNIPAERRVAAPQELQEAAAHIGFNAMNDVQGSVAGFDVISTKVDSVAKRQGKKHVSVVVEESNSGNLYKFGVVQSLEDPWDVQLTSRPENCQIVTSNTNDYWEVSGDELIPSMR